jgi:hypothetical protein
MEIASPFYVLLPTDAVMTQIILAELFIQKLKGPAAYYAYLSFYSFKPVFTGRTNLWVCSFRKNSSPTDIRPDYFMANETMGMWK